MLRTLAIIITLAAVPYTAVASEPVAAAEPATEVHSAPKILVNRSLETYLEGNENAKLLLGCGHNGELDPKAMVPCVGITVKLPNPRTGVIETYVANQRFKHSKDFAQQTKFHSHDGWYTVDMDPELRPDVLGDLTKTETQDHVFRPCQFKLVRQELLPDELLTHNLFAKIAQCLAPGGSFICSLPGAVINNSVQIGQAKNLAQVWKTALDKEPGDFKKERGFKVQVEYDNLNAVMAQMLPYFKHLGFSDVRVHQSLGTVYCALINQNCNLKSYTRVPDGRMILIGSIFDEGPHPEAIQLDKSFGDLFMGDLYIIAKK
jgi:hypothetical protein